MSLRSTACPAAWRPFTSVPPRSSAPPRVCMGRDHESMAPAPSRPSLRLRRDTSTARHSDSGASMTPCGFAASSKPVARSMQPVHAWSSAIASFEPQHAPLSLDAMVLALQTSTFRLCVRQVRTSRVSRGVEGLSMPGWFANSHICAQHQADSPCKHECLYQGNLLKLCSCDLYAPPAGPSGGPAHATAATGPGRDVRSRPHPAG